MPGNVHTPVAVLGEMACLFPAVFKQYTWPYELNLVRTRSLLPRFAAQFIGIGALNPLSVIARTLSVGQGHVTSFRHRRPRSVS